MAGSSTRNLNTLRILKSDPCPDIPRAGKATKMFKEDAKATIEGAAELPGTPTGLAKYRHPAHGEPGRKYVRGDAMTNIYIYREREREICLLSFFSSQLWSIIRLIFLLTLLSSSVCASVSKSIRQASKQLHYGVADDTFIADLSQPFGVQTAKGEGVETIIRQYPESPLLQLSLDVQQRIYESSRSVSLGPVDRVDVERENEEK